MRYIVRTVYGRERYVDYLLKRIPDLEVLVDPGLGAMFNFFESLRRANHDAVVHLEDDIILTKNFVQKVEKAVEQHSMNLIQFFSMRKKDLEIGSRWEPGGSFMMNQCVYMPPEMGLRIMKHYDEWEGKEGNPTGYDLLMADYMKKKKLRYWIQVPSLVDHRQVRSMINPKRSSKRQSLTFLEPDLDGV